MTPREIIARAEELSRLPRGRSRAFAAGSCGNALGKVLRWQAGDSPEAKLWVAKIVRHALDACNCTVSESGGEQTTVRNRGIAFVCGQGLEDVCGGIGLDVAWVRNCIRRMARAIATDPDIAAFPKVRLHAAALVERLS